MAKRSKQLQGLLFFIFVCLIKITQSEKSLKHKGDINSLTLVICISTPNFLHTCTLYLDNIPVDNFSNYYVLV